MTRFDLHLHTTASDGSDTPREMAAICAEMGIGTIAITDHDTVSGLPEAIAAGRQLGIQVISGTELSADYETELHILGYGINYNSSAMDDFFGTQQRRRQQRNPLMVEKLRRLGMDITMDEVQALAAGPICGRMHIGQVLVEKGYCGSVAEAFDRWIAFGKPAFVPRAKATIDECLSAIGSGGGQPVFAHPGIMEVPIGEIERLAAMLKAQGLVGMECFYPAYDDETADAMLSVARNLGLVPTYGSDCHGKIKDIRPGQSFDRFHIPSDTLDWVDSLKKESQS